MDLYVVGTKETYTIPIEHLYTTPADLNVRNVEQHKMESTMHFLIKMSNKDKKSTDCVFTKDKLIKPQAWKEIMNEEFYMVNGQHCMEASKQMQDKQDVDEKIRKFFNSCEYFVVWNEDKSMI